MWQHSLIINILSRLKDIGAIGSELIILCIILYIYPAW